MADLVTLGELLVDFVAADPGAQPGEATTWSAAPGGAPANVAVGAARLGVATAFLGKVGDDPFGRMLARTLGDEGVDVRGLHFDPSARTALAFVTLAEGGERSFHFYRHPSADMLYRAEEVDLEAIRAARIFHFGSISLIGEPSRSATLRALDEARAANLLITFDPNLRLDLWPGEEEARDRVLEAMGLADVVKLSDEELEFLSGSRDIDARWEPSYGLDMLIVTRGAAGVDYLAGDDVGKVAGFAAQAVDTTGAGDSFVAAVLAGLVADPNVMHEPDSLRELLRRANACAALAVTGTGAIPSLPTLLRLEEFLDQHSSSK